MLNRCASQPYPDRITPPKRERAKQHCGTAAKTPEAKVWEKRSKAGKRGSAYTRANGLAGVWNGI